jgi:hypothetical protein
MFPNRCFQVGTALGAEVGAITEQVNAKLVDPVLSLTRPAGRHEVVPTVLEDESALVGRQHLTFSA